MARVSADFLVFDFSGFKISRACRQLYRRCAIAREREERFVDFVDNEKKRYTGWGTRYANVPTHTRERRNLGSKN
jgi:hypothetical protein